MRALTKEDERFLLELLDREQRTDDAREAELLRELWAHVAYERGIRPQIVRRALRLVTR